MSGRCFGYVRVSTLDQAKGVSTAAQAARIRAYCTLNGLSEPIIFEDAGEGGHIPFAERKAGAKLIAELRPGDNIILPRVDRGFRNLLDFLHWFDAWLQTDKKIHVLDFGGNTIDATTTTGRFIFKMFALFAELERERISERCLEVTRYMASKGMRITSASPPTGFKTKKNKHGRGYFVVPDPEARRVMGQIWEWRFTQKKTLKAIAEHLTVSGVPPIGKKKKWTDCNVWFVADKENKLRMKEQKEVAS